MQKIYNIFNKIDKFAFSIAQFAMLVLMVLTTADAIMRYGFNKSIIGAYHFSEKYLMVIIVFLSMSYVMKLKGHIQIDLFTDRMPVKINNIFQVIYSILGAIFMFLIGYQSMLVTSEAFIFKYTSTGLIPWPTWLSWIWVPIGAYLFTIRLIFNAINILLNFNKPSLDIEEVENISE